MREKLKARARQLTGDDGSAEDMVQEVMLRLWSMRGKLDRHTCHEALALTMLRNMAADNRRKQRLGVAYAADCKAAGATGGAGDAAAYEDNSAETADEMVLIRRIIDALPPLQGRILRMKEIEGYGSDEIIKITGCSPESLRQNLSRARRRIRDEFIRITERRK